MREARRQLRNTSAAQWALPLVMVEGELARSGGDLDAARAIVERALARETAGEEQRYKWPVMSLGARIEAERAQTERTLKDADERAKKAIDERDALAGNTFAIKLCACLQRMIGVLFDGDVVAK